MKKLSITLIATGMLLFFTGCEKGKVSGKVINPFTGKAVENATVWMPGTPHTVKTPDGNFVFEDVDLGSFAISAGKNKYSKTEDSISLGEEQLEASIDLFIFPKSNIKPGLFRMNAEKEDKIMHEWYLHEVRCEDAGFAYKTSFKDKKSKKDQKLNDPAEVSKNINLLFYNATSASQLPVAKVYPLKTDRVSNHKGCKFEKGEKTALFPVTDKGSELKVTYKSENLYALEGSIPEGEQALVLTQGGKFLKSYYIKAK